MALGRIELVHNFDGETGYVIITWRKTTSPLTDATGFITGSNLGAQDGTTTTKAVYSFPHGQESLLIEQLDPIMYTVKAFRSADGITPDEQINVLAVDAGIAAKYILTLYTYVVDRGQPHDPIDGDHGIRDERLLGQKYTVTERGTGPLIPPEEVGPEYIDRSDDGGGFDFVDPEKTLNNGGVYFVTVQERQDATGSSAPAVSEVSDIFILDEDQDFDPSAMSGKLLVADGASDILKLTFPNSSILPDCSFKVQTQGGMQLFLTLQFDTGDSIKLNGEDKNAIHLGKGEACSIVIKDNIIRLITAPKGYERLGEERPGRKIEVNTIVADMVTRDQLKYPRIVEYINSLPVVLSYAAQATDKGKWAKDDVAHTFRPPDLRGQFIRFLADPIGEVPGRSEVGMVGPHIHRVKTGGSNTVDPRLALRGSNISDGFGVGTSDTFIEQNSGTETRPNNIGEIPLIYI